MDRDSKKIRVLRRGRKSDSFMLPPPPAALAGDGRTRRTKRKASPDKTNPRKRTRVSESESQKKPEREVLHLPDPTPEKIRRKRRLLRDQSSDPLEGCSSNMDYRPKRGAKRKATTAGEEPNGKRRRSEEEQPTQVPSGEKLSESAQRAFFEDKYKQQDLLGEGGFGSVYAGYRKADKLPVAIKYVAKQDVYFKHKLDDGNKVSVEVAIMLKLAGETNGPVGTSAVISLLDWYELDKKLVLVMERPVPSEDLFHYICGNGGNLSEEEAKIIMKQLVDAALQLQENHIFHRDIKVENILIETSSDVPRVRLIDFGLSCFFKKRSRYRHFYGTEDHTPPEWYVLQTYKEGPTTVWQLGVVLFETLHFKRFETCRFVREGQKISRSMSRNCRDFLQKCLTINPQDRITLQQLQQHQWLR